MPWQEYVADVAGEFDPVTGRPFYRTVLISTPRQQGKSILVLAKMLERCTLWDEPQVCVYTAQNGFEAGKKVIKSWHPQIKRSKLQKLLDKGAKQGLRMAAGNQGIDFLNGSRIDVQASAESSGHGDTVDDGTIDEAWHDTDYRREQALRPAMLTRQAAQLWVVSTAGTDASTYWNATQDAGRLAAQEDNGRDVCYFEWSCPDDVDPLDPAGWPLYMPALGHSIHAETVQADIAALQMEPTEIARAYGNRRQSRSALSPIPPQTWDLVNDPDAQPQGSIVFGVDATPEREAAAIVSYGGDVVELIDHRPQVAWVVERAADLHAKWTAPFAIDPAGPAASLIAPLEERGIKIIKVGGRDLTAACGAMFDAIVSRQITFRRHPLMDEAVAGAAKRTSGDSWVWARRSAVGDSSPLMAATIARWAMSAPKPTFAF